MTTLKRPLVLLAATLWTAVCLALPAPHDIAQAVGQGQLGQAEQMLREVIAEKPTSAKAHYELAQVLAREGRHSEALQALREARALDPSLKFAQSPDKFNAIAKAIEQQAAAAQRPAPAVSSAPSPAAPAANAPAHAQASWFWPALLSGLFALLVWTVWRRWSSRPALQPQAPGLGPLPEGPRGFGAQYDPRGPAPGYGNAYPTAGPAPGQAPGSGVAGAVVGGLAGVAAGYALSKALEGRDTGHDSAHAASTDGQVTPRPNGASGPMDDVGLVRLDDASDLGSFDAGSGDDWGAPADDDTW